MLRQMPHLFQVELLRAEAQRRAVRTAIFLPLHAQHTLVPGSGQLNIGAPQLDMVDPVDREAHQPSPAKKSLPLSSMTMKAGKSFTSIFHTASMPSSGYSRISTLVMLFSANTAAGPPIEPR